MKFFNTAGPVNMADHYALPPLSRWDQDDVMMLLSQKKYFILHAPRQTGKTSALLALMEILNQENTYTCLYVNIEAAQAARGNVARGIATVCSCLSESASVYLDDERLLQWFAEKRGVVPDENLFTSMLQIWARNNDKPIVLLLDEVDSLVGDTLISLLRQIRAGYTQRPSSFPQSIILCGVRDVQDYRIHSSGKEIITGGSAFNIKAESLRLGNFSRDETTELYAQHTKETGQCFEYKVFDLVWDLTHGQPWLVNALAYEVCFKIKSGRNRNRPITVEIIHQAKENIIQRRETHLNQLTDKLKEPRVHRVIAPMLQNQSIEKIETDDFNYVIDLGLIEKGDAGPRIANDIYKEIIPRELTFITQMNFESMYNRSWYITQDNYLDMDKLLAAFQDFFRENSESWIQRFDYKEAGPQLLLQAFLQRIVNSGGRIHREYGLGRRRTDLFIQWPIDSEQGFYGPMQKVVIELKILYKSLDITKTEGLEQTFDYMDKCGADEGHLIIFNRNPEMVWEEKIFFEDKKIKDGQIKVWGM
ncbi:MAG: ATP-binding protein [Desulfobulbaceae bacterium]|nr:ATP-binding protein [Desulfobulbaceae bacterium]